MAGDTGNTYGVYVDVPESEESPEDLSLDRPRAQRLALAAPGLQLAGDAGSSDSVSTKLPMATVDTTTASASGDDSKLEEVCTAGCI